MGLARLAGQFLLVHQAIPFDLVLNLLNAEPLTETPFGCDNVRLRQCSHGLDRNDTRR